MPTHDPALQRLIEQVRAAHEARTPLEIRGGGSKAFYGGAPHGEWLDLRPLAGISSHEPSELVVTVRAGTPLAELEAALAEHGQCLPFEPPRFASRSGTGQGASESVGTVGGMVAAGLAGPARASVGSVRDYVLGVTMLNGRGESLSFGGQVIKNVAGYDVSRALAGSMGVLGVICEVSLKVLAKPQACRTLLFETSQQDALKRLNVWAGQPLPLNASAWQQGQLHLRLAGAHAAVQAACQKLGGSELAPAVADVWWDSLRDQRQRFFELDDAALASGECLWRLSVPSTTPELRLPASISPGEWLVEWGGAQRWWRGHAEPQPMRDLAASVDGHATLYRAANKSVGTFTPLSVPLLRIHRQMKQAFDPAGIFNPGRLYADLGSPTSDEPPCKPS
jgi:glycolate oxidase FAD binding subunit